MRLRSQIVRRIHGAVKKFVVIMVALSGVRALLVGLLIWACGVPGRGVNENKHSTDVESTSQF
jgi:hypothetical protein